MAPDFNSIASLYDSARPGYPAALFSDLKALCKLKRTARVLEVGCGTGQATKSLAAYGYSVEAIDRGPALVSIAKKRLAGFHNVHFTVKPFDQFRSRPSSFDLIVFPTSFHLLEAPASYRQIRSLLKSGGSAAFLWNLLSVETSSPGFHDSLHTLYTRCVPKLQPPYFPVRKASGVDSKLRELKDTGLFDPIFVKRYEWQLTCDASHYFDLLQTYFDHSLVSLEEKSYLADQLYGLVRDRFDGKVVQGYRTALYVGVKKVGSSASRAPKS
jgi:SAM-dependent methyltransferase